MLAEHARVMVRWLSHKQQGRLETVRQVVKWQDLQAMPAAAPSLHQTIRTWQAKEVLVAGGNSSLSFGEYIRGTSIWYLSIMILSNEGGNASMWLNNMI